MKGGNIRTTPFVNAAMRGSVSSHIGKTFRIRDTFGKQANQRISARQTGQRRRFKQQFKVFNHLFIGNIAVMNVMRTVQQDISRIRHMGFSIDDDVAVSLHKQIDFALA